MALGEKRKKRLSSPMHQSATASLSPMRQSDFHSTEDEQSWRRHTGKGRCRPGPSWVRFKELVQAMVDKGFIEFGWAPEQFELRLPKGLESEEERSPSPPPKVSSTKKAGKAGGEDMEMAEAEEVRPKRTVKRTAKARQLEEKDEYVITPPLAPRPSQGGASTRASGAGG